MLIDFAMLEQPQPSAELTTLQQRVRDLNRDRMQAQDIIRTADEAAKSSALKDERERIVIREVAGALSTLTALKGTIDEQAEADEAKAAQRARAAPMPSPTPRPPSPAPKLNATTQPRTTPAAGPPR